MARCSRAGASRAARSLITSRLGPSGRPYRAIRSSAASWTSSRWCPKASAAAARDRSVACGRAATTVPISLSCAAATALPGNSSAGADAARKSSAGSRPAASSRPQAFWAKVTTALALTASRPAYLSARTSISSSDGSSRS